MQPIRIGFLVNCFVGWTGGSNYLRNLLIAIHSIPNKKIEAFLFINSDVDSDFLKTVKPYVNLVKFGKLYHSGFPFLYKKKLHKWYRNQQLYKRIELLNIKVMSHSNMYSDDKLFFKVNWIPDFQHIHLPEMFTEKDCSLRSSKCKDLITGSDAVVLSSDDAINDADTFFPGYREKLHRLAFVSVPDENISEGKERILALEKKYGFSGKYFYLPNQFWKHKNHSVVFEAVRRLKVEGIEILVLCTGDLTDYRNEDHIDVLRNFITKHNLSNNIHLLGKIPYTDVLSLFRFSLAIINPSFFEGWSSTVEEAKSLGKKVILSNIAVHLEQAASRAEYFDSMKPEELSSILLENWKDLPHEDLFTDETTISNLQERIVAYGNTYQDIILEVTGGK